MFVNYLANPDNGGQRVQYAWLALVAAFERLFFCF